jgi:2-hydroxy-6-oxonona-2,4-dienedioate hydrolase
MASTMWLELLGLGVEQRWVDAGGVRTRALVAGDPANEAVVFLHGTGGHAEAYGRNLAAHAEKFRVYSIDMIGHGFSDKPERSYEIDTYVEHLVDFMDAEGLPRAHLSGESLGGWVAARFAALYPDRVDHLVLNTAGGRTLDPNVMKRIKDLSLDAVQNPTPAKVRTRLEFLMADPASVTDELVEIRRAIYVQPEFAVAMPLILSLQEVEIRRRNLLSDEELKAIKSPTLVVWTTHDPTASVEVGRAFADAIPDAEFVVLEDCGHWPQWESADEFNSIHIGFLERA